MKVIYLAFLVAMSFVRTTIVSVPVNHVGFKNTSAFSVIACEHCQSVSFSKAVGDMAGQFIMKALLVAATAIKDVFNTYLKVQVRIAWSIESFRSAVVSWTFVSGSNCPEWSGNVIDHVGQALSSEQDASFAGFLLFFAWGCWITYQLIEWFVGELSFAYRSGRRAGPWVSKRPWHIALNKLIGLFYDMFRSCQLQTFIASVEPLDDFAKEHYETLERLSFSDDEENVSEQLEAEISTDSVETSSVSVNDEESLSMNLEATVPVDPVETTSVSTATADDSKTCESQCKSSTDEDDAPKQLQPAMQLKSSLQRAAGTHGEDGIYKGEVFMPFAEPSPSVTTEEDREHLKMLLEREIKKLSPIRLIEKSSLQLAASKEKSETVPIVKSSLQLAVSIQRAAGAHGEDGIYEGEIFMPFAEPSPSVTTKEDREHLKMLLEREITKLSPIRPIEKSSLQLTASKEKSETVPIAKSSLQLAASKEEPEPSPIAKSSLQLAASKETLTKPKVVSSLQALAQKEFVKAEDTWLSAPLAVNCSLEGDTKHWDQFKANKELVNEHKVFDEAIYTIVLDRANIPNEQVEQAEEIARSIECKPCSRSTGNECHQEVIGKDSVLVRETATSSMCTPDLPMDCSESAPMACCDIQTSRHVQGASKSNQKRQRKNRNKKGTKKRQPHVKRASM